MMQGDSYGLPIEIKNSGGTAVTPEDVSDVEIVIGHLIKTYKKNEIGFNADSGVWIFPLTQEETFSFPAMRVKGQARIAWASGGVEGVRLEHIDVSESYSKEVL